MFLKHFGLKTQPFGVTPDPRFVYLSREHEEAFASLVYGIEMGRGFAALIAAPGLGKTTMLLRLMEHLQDSARTAFLFQTHLQSGEFLKSLMADLGVESKSQSLSDLQRQLSDVLIQEWHAGKRVVVAIDEAQNLDNSTLEMIRMLSNFETPRAKLLHIILSGQKELADRLGRPELEQLRQRVSIVTHFPPFPPEEVVKYIEHRLRIAGFNGGELFAPAALRMIATHSGGVPRNINNLCFHALSLTFAKNQKVVTDSTMQEVLSDLNLHRLGTKPNVATISTAPAFATRPETGGLYVGRGSTPVVHPVGVRRSTPIAFPADAALDAVDLSSHTKTGPAMHVVQEAVSAPRERSWIPDMTSPVRASGLILMAGVFLASFWAGPWIKAELESMAASISGPTQSAANKPDLQSRESLTAPLADSSSRNSGMGEGRPSKKPAPVTTRRATEWAGGFVNNENDANHSDSPDQSAGSDSRDESPAATASHGSDARQDAFENASNGVPVQGFLVVESSRSGARIAVNGRSSPGWVTPHRFSLTSGVYSIQVEMAGYRPWTQRVHLEGSRERFLVADLQLIDRDGGIFALETDPPGMQVFVDGKPYGPSRVETALTEGWHVCEVISGPGAQPIVSRFHLASGETMTKRIRVSTSVLTPSNDRQAQLNIWNLKTN